jgi:hypothetical protein
LDAPYRHDEFEFSEINLDFVGKITPRMQENLEGRYRREILSKSKNLSAEMFGTYHEKPFVDKKFRFLVFEFLTGMPVEAILNDSFPIATYNEILDAISSFFTTWRDPSSEAPPGTEAEEAYHED